MKGGVHWITWRSWLRSRVNSSTERDITLTFIVSRSSGEGEANQSLCFGSSISELERRKTLGWLVEGSKVRGKRGFRAVWFTATKCNVLFSLLTRIRVGPNNSIRFNEKNPKKLCIECITVWCMHGLLKRLPRTHFLHTLLNTSHLIRWRDFFFKFIGF